MVDFSGYPTLSFEFPRFRDDGDTCSHFATSALMNLSRYHAVFPPVFALQTLC
jgi:hypothetical protein